MKTPLDKQSLRYLPKIWSTVVFLLLLLLVFALFQGRKEGFWRLAFISEIIPGYHQHISNFSISYLLYAGIGYLWLMAGVRLVHIALLGAFLVLCKLTYELWFPFLNTMDVIDAIYGIVGTMIGFLFLLLVKQCGLKPNSED